MTTSPQPLRLLIAGSTGVVGREVLRLALADARIAAVVAPTRRPLAAHPKLENPVTDFNTLPADADWLRVDAVICTLGTTIKTAGSKEAFAAIDRDLAVRMAQLARQGGATRFGLNSSLGAGLTGNFYLKTKAEAEAGIRALGFASYVIVRPSLIDAKRSESRLGEEIGLAAMGLFKPLVPKRYRAVKPEAIARALLEGVISGRPGEEIVESERLQ